MNKDMYELVARIRDHYQQAEASATAIVDVCERILKVGVKKVFQSFDTGKIKWQTKEGGKGMYEMATKADNAENSDFKALMANLREKDGRLRVKKEQMFYWLFESGDAIGRKPYQVKEKAPAPAPTPPLVPPAAPAKTEEAKLKSAEDVKMLFPKDLEDMLLFEQTETHITIRPRQYLGSDNFAKIAAIVRDQGGEYVSAGKESHFRIPRK